MDYHNSWIPSKSTISYFSPTTILDITGEMRIYSNRILHIMAYYCPIWPYYSIPLPLTLEYWGGVRQEFFWEIFHPITWNIHPPRVFGLPKEVGGSSGCQTLALVFEDCQKRTESYCCNGISGGWFCTSPALERENKHGNVRFSWFARTWPHPPVPADT
jgi:hypothetical protein